MKRIGFVLLCLLAASAASAIPTDAALQSAKAALSRGDAIAAEAELRQAMRDGARQKDVAALLGEAEFLQGNLDDARRWLNQATLAGPYLVRGLRVLARIEQRDGDLEAAANALQLALTAGGDRADIWTDIARLRYAAGNHLGAIEASDFAVGLDDAGPPTLLYKAQLVRDAHGLTAALPWLRAAIEFAPHDPAILGEYAATLSDAGRATDALEVTRQLLKRDPGNTRAFFIQAIVAARAEKYALARRLYARTSGAFDNTAAGLLLTGMLELRGGTARFASEKLFTLAETAPDIAADPLAEALLNAGDGTELNARFAIASAQRQTTSAVSWYLVRSLEADENRAAAAQLFDRAADRRWGGAVRRGDAAIVKGLAQRYRSDPSNIDTATAYVRTLLAVGREQDALTVAQNLTAEHPANLYSQMALGDAALSSGDPQLAITAYSTVARIRSGPLLVRKLAFAHLDRGNQAAAKSLLAKYVLQYPLNRDLATVLGTIMLREGSVVDASKLLAATHPVARRDPLGLARLAWAQLRAGDTETAEKNARAAYALQRSNVSASAVLAAVLAVNGKELGTVKALQAKGGTITEQAAINPLLAL